MKKLGAEFILGAILLPIIVAVFASISNLQTADAVQQTRLEYIIEMNVEQKTLLNEIRRDVKELKEK